VGVAAQPVSRALDFVSKAADGANASRLKLTALAPKQSQKRWRLPRAIKGDHVLQPFDLYSAQGQASPISCFIVNGPPSVRHTVTVGRRFSQREWCSPLSSKSQSAGACQIPGRRVGGHALRTGH